MKANKDFVMREIAGEHILVPTGKASEKLYGLVTLEGSGLFLWNLLQEECTEAQLLQAMLDEYEVEPDVAAADLEKFLTTLRESGLIEEA